MSIGGIYSKFFFLYINGQPMGLKRTLNVPIHSHETNSIESILK